MCARFGVESGGWGGGRKRKSREPRPGSRRARGRSVQIFGGRAPYGCEQPRQLPACGCRNGSGSPDGAGAGVCPCARSGQPPTWCAPRTSPVACALPRPPHPTHAAFLVAWTTTPFAAARQTRATCSPPRARASVCQHSTVPPRILSFLPPSGLLLVILLLPRWLRCCRCPLPPVSFAPAGSHG